MAETETETETETDIRAPQACALVWDGTGRDGYGGVPVLYGGSPSVVPVGQLQGRVQVY